MNFIVWSGNKTCLGCGKKVINTLSCEEFFFVSSSKICTCPLCKPSKVPVVITAFFILLKLSKPLYIFNEDLLKSILFKNKKIKT